MENPCISKRQNELMTFFAIAIVGFIFGVLVGQNLRIQQIFMLNNISTNPVPHIEELHIDRKESTTLGQRPNKTNEVCVPSNPRGIIASLPPGLIASESDLYPRRLWGHPNEDLTTKPKYLVAFTVGFAQKNNIDLAVKKFLGNFTIVLFHYDEQTNEWNEFEWSKNVIHISVKKQTKWWYAKRFLHPDIVVPYDYIFIWDEDLGVEHFNPEEYIKIVEKHGLEISQPAVESEWGYVWNITKRKSGQEIHKELDQEEKPGWCKEYKPPCAGFVEIMAPVFSRNAWKCVWHMIQNDLVHGWGLDRAFGKCVEPAQENMGIVDAQWIIHQHIPSLGNQGEGRDGQPPFQGVKARCQLEALMFQKRLQ